MTRAKSLQQHKQGVLATPVVKATRMKDGSSQNMSRRSLSSLFRSPIKDSSNEVNRTGTVHAENSSSPAKVGRKSQSGSFHSPLKMALRGYQAANMEQKAASQHYTNLDSSPKLWRRSLSGLFHSPPSGNLSRSKSEAISVDEQVTKGIVSDSDSSDIFVTIHSQDATMLGSQEKKETTLIDTCSVSAAGDLPSQRGPGSLHSPIDGQSNCCDGKTIEQTQRRHLRKRKKGKSRDHPVVGKCILVHPDD